MRSWTGGRKGKETKYNHLFERKGCVWVLPMSLKRHKKKKGGVVQKSLASAGSFSPRSMAPWGIPGGGGRGRGGIPSYVTQSPHDPSKMSLTRNCGMQGVQQKMLRLGRGDQRLGGEGCIRSPYPETSTSERKFGKHRMEESWKPTELKEAQKEPNSSPKMTNPENEGKNHQVNAIRTGDDYGKPR